MVEIEEIYKKYYETYTEACVTKFSNELVSEDELRGVALELLRERYKNINPDINKNKNKVKNHIHIKLRRHKDKRLNSEKRKERKLEKELLQRLKREDEEIRKAKKLERIESLSSAVKMKEKKSIYYIEEEIINKLNTKEIALKYNICPRAVNKCKKRFSDLYFSDLETILKRGN